MSSEEVSIFDNLSTDLKENTQQLGDTNYSFYDADTLYDPEGNGYRLQGINAFEVDSSYKDGELGGQLTVEEVSRLANEKGFTNLVKLGRKAEGSNREMADLQDDQGRSFSRELAASGLARVQEGFDQSGSLTFSNEFRSFLKSSPDYEENDFDKAATKVDSFIKENEAYSSGLKAQVVSDRLSKGFQYTDRDEEGMAFNPKSVAWDVGITGMRDAAFGMLEMFGEKTGIETLEVTGGAGVKRARNDMQKYGQILTDYNDVDSFGSAVEYLANNAILSLPYMGLSAVAAVAAPFTGGLSYLAPASIYTGQAWNEMGDQIEGTDKQRSASIAIATGVAQAALDRLGLKGITGSSGSILFNKGVAQLMKGSDKLPPMSKELAEGMMATATKKQMVDLIEDVATVAKEQLEYKRLTVDLLRRMRNGSITEGATEGLQEAIAGIGADLGSQHEIDWKDIHNRAVNGAVAGASLGGAFSVPGAAIDAGQWANIAWGKSAEDPEDVEAATRYAREEYDANYKRLIEEGLSNGLSLAEAEKFAEYNARVPDIEEILNTFNNDDSYTEDPLESLEFKAEREAKKKKNRGFKDLISDTMSSIPALFRGQVANLLPPELVARSRAARFLKDMLGGSGGKRVFAGSSFENAKHHLMSLYKNILHDDPENIYLDLNDGKKVSDKDRERISKEVYSYLTDPTLLNADGVIDPSLLPDSPRKATLTALILSMQALQEKEYKDQLKYNPELNQLKNYLFRFKTINKKAVYKNQKKFIEALLSTYSEMSRQEAITITDQIANGDMDLDEAFTVIKGGVKPSSHQRRSLGLSEKPEFQQFFEQDLMTNMSASAKTAARYVTSQQYIGKNGLVISRILEEMQREGLSESEIDEVAYGVKNFLDSESGNYKRATTPLGKSLQAIQKSFMLFTMFAGLPLSALSSFVELALGMRGLTRDQIFGKNNGLSKLGQELAQMLKDGMTEIADIAPIGQGKRRNFNTSGKDLLRKLGFYDWDVGAATTTGVLETHSFHQKMAERYFKWIGLQGWTSFNRATRAAIAVDFINDNLFILLDRDVNNKGNWTNEEREAEEKLRNLGLDVSLAGVNSILDFIKYGEAFEGLDPDAYARVDSQMREAIYSFVNEAVALPQAANRPLWYLDPRFALLNQFQGFMATFTANHIPRMWNEYIKRGSPAMRYNTFAMMTTMIMLGFASQYLKDLLKYGETTPYLDESELIRRGILSSGLAGTSERVIEQFFPIYETRSKDAGEWIWNTASGESPSLSNLAKIGSAVGDVVEGDMDKAGWKVAKATIGPLANVIDNIYNKASKWDY